MQRELQEAWAANRVLDHAQAPLGGNLWRTFEIRKEENVVVRSVEIGMVENVECIGFKLQQVALFDLEHLGQTHIEAHLERASKSVPACISIQGFIEIATACIASRDSIGPRSHKLGSEISRVELTEGRRNSHRSHGANTALSCLLGGYPWEERHNGIPNIVACAVVQTRHRARKVIDAVGLPALRHGLATNGPAIGRKSPWPA